MGITVLVNFSQSSSKAVKVSPCARVGSTTVVIDISRSWIASVAERRWETGATDHVFLKAADIAEAVVLDEFLDEIARSTDTVHFVTSFDDEQRLRLALARRPELQSTFARFDEEDALSGLVHAGDVSEPRVATPTSSLQKKLGVLLIHIESYEITRACLSSIEATTYPHTSVFLLENASSNFSALRLFLEFPAVVFLFGTARISYCNSFNLLADAAIRHGSEYLFVSNNDTRGHSPNIFEALISGVSGSIGMVSPKVYDFDHALLRSGSVNHFGVNFSLATEAYVISSALWQQVEGFTNSFNIYCEDVDLLLRVRALGQEGRYDASVELEHLQNGVTANKVFIRSFFYMRNIVWLQKARNIRLVYDIAYFSAQESIQLLLWAGRLARKGDVYPLLAVIFFVPCGILAGMLTRPQRNKRSDLARALRRSTWELKFTIR
jgi:GT2 family glycosyltransferase